MSSGFAELAARSHYSFLEGASSPERLVEAAAALGIPALGVCDRNGLYGAVELVQAARRAGVRPVVGAELDLADGTALRLLARDREGYRQLCRAVSAAQLAGEKGQPLLRIDGVCDPAPPAAVETAHASRRRRRPLLDPPARPAALRPTRGPFPGGWPGLPSTRERATGTAAIVDPADLGGCTVLAGGPDAAVTRALVAGDRRAAVRHADRLREAFGRDRVALLLTHHLHPADAWLAAETAALARRCGLPMVASNTPAHATAGDKPLLDVLTAIRHRTTLDGAAAHGLLLPNAEHRVKSAAELQALLRDHPEAFDHAVHVAAQCSVSLDFGDVRFPGFPVPEGETPFSVLYRLCQEGAQRRYRPMTSRVAARLQRELDVIEKTGLAEFFLITWDIMRFARQNGIPGQGRGSAADSIVAYLLGITRVDPVEHDLLFERFLHEDHQGTPDIDIDFSTDHREQVIQYVYEKYGPERTGMVANVVTFRPRMAVRQVGAAMGFPETVVDRLARSVDGWYRGDVEDALEAAGLMGLVTDEATAEGAAPATGEPSAGALPWRLFSAMLAAVEGTPRHLGIHVGGMLVTGAPLVDVAPVERATMPGRVVVQFDKDDVEDLGLIKMDLLGLRTLSVVAECLELVEATTGERPDLDELPLDDPLVYDTIGAPDTIGLFQIESRAQQQSLYQSQPREFNDLIVQVAIIRPGPIQGNAVHPYLRRRQGLEPVTYPHPLLEPILADTRGVVLYQEQILRIVMDVAGYTAGEADRFRRAMNRHRGTLRMETLRDEFIDRCEARGLPRAVAEEIFRSVAGFAVYGFCKSHAAAFARTAYETAWLRLHHPAAYLCALLNAQPMGFYHPSVLVEDGKRHGVRTLPVDAARSRARCTLEWAGDATPPVHAVHAGITPGWSVDGDGGVVRDAAPRPATRGEGEAERAVAAACRAVAGTPPRPPLPRSPRLGGPMSPWAVRLGYAYVHGLGPGARAACDEAWQAGATGSVAEFWRHTLLPRPAMENLVMVGAFDGVGGGRPRRELLWELRAAEDALPPRPAHRAAPDLREAMPGSRARLGTDAARAGGVAPPAAPAASSPSPRSAHAAPRGLGTVAGARPGDGARTLRDPAVDPSPPLLTEPARAPHLPAMSERDHVAAEYRVSALSTGEHLVAFMRPALDRLGCTPLAAAGAVADGHRLRVGGLVIARQAPMTGKGFRFFTLADETGHLDLVFRPRIVARFRSVANFHSLLLVDGTLQVEGGRLNLVVDHVRALDGEGRVIDAQRARLGGGADTIAPPQQHGHVRPAAELGDGDADVQSWDAPASHDYR